MRLKSNKPVHGMGLMGRATEIKPLKANAHVPQRTNTGYSDRSGYEGSPARRNGRHTGSIPPGDMSKRSGPAGLGKGSAPGGRPGVALTARNARAGRGGPAKIGKSDAYKGKPKMFPEDISSKAFERLGAD